MPPRTLRPAVLKLLLASIVLVSSTLKAQEITAVWSGAIGNWTDASNWSTKPYFPNNNGAQSYSVLINSGSVTLNQDITVEDLMFGVAGSPTLRANTNSRNDTARNPTLNVESDFRLNQGLITGNATLHALGTATIAGNTNLYGWRLMLSGHTMWSGRLGAGNASVIDNLPGAALDLSTGAVCTYYFPDSGNPNGWKRTLNNYGRINARGGIGTTLDVNLNSPGTINVKSGPLVLSGGGTISGPINLTDGATLDFENSNIPSGASYVLTPTSSISGSGSVKFISNAAVSGVYDITGTTTVGGSVGFLSPITNPGSSLVVIGQFASCDLGSNSIIVGSLNLRSGALTGSGIVKVNGPLEWNDGSMFGVGTTIAQNGVFFNGLTGLGGFDQLGRTLNCYGLSSVQTTAPYQGVLYFGSHAALNIMPEATFNGSRLMILGSSVSGQTNGIVTNYGTLVVDDPGVNRGMSVFGTAFLNQGNIFITNSTLDVRTTMTNQPAFVQAAGSVQLNNGTLASNKSNIQGGSLSGHGTVRGIVSNGLIAPSGGSLVFSNSSLALQSDSVLSYTLNGTQPGVSFGYMTDVSTATLGGELQITLSGGFQLQVQSSDTFTVLTAQSIAGQFTNVVSGARLTTVDGSGSFVVTYSGNQVVLSNFLPN